MDIYGFVGHPAKHTLSPPMHNAGFHELGIYAKYEAFDVLPKNLKTFVERVKNGNIKGLSISQPHKQTIMAYLDEISDFAKKIMAVNTIVSKNGKLFGTNVDWIGIQDAILDKTPIEGKKVVILGAGGACRAAIFAMQENKASEIIILNRTVEKAQKLAEEFGVRFGALSDFAQHNPDIIIQATSAGLGDPDGIEIIPKELLKSSMTIMEMIYNPMMTRILKDGQKKGATIITGEKMLAYQGFAQFELWTNQKAPKKIMLKAIHDNLK
ncbi:shikimate dehydrogenase [Patescibacteria group bacterium]|nr:shikimate dehydrogenase [Patescibacteria group bacterium]